jgi:2-(1,2-epoxy-1,2-dihydrophenyl)acetyl-CoA isomerase
MKSAISVPVPAVAASPTDALLSRQASGEQTMQYEHIAFDQAEGVVTITLNRPRFLNALNGEMVTELIHAADRIRDEGTARAVLMTGAGRAFSSGADLMTGDLRNDDAGAVLETHFNPLLERLVRLPVPLVTAVNGPAAGAGCSLALAGDIVLVARSAYFLQAFINIGLIPDVGSTWMLPRLVGRSRAMAMMMLGERIPAEKAEQWGMVYKAVDDEALAPESKALVGRLAAGPTVALGLIREAMRSSLEGSLTETLATERRNQRRAGRTADFREGVAAFRAKRPAAFEGK